MQKRLYRNTDEKMIAGVCAGLADYFGLDQALWRIVFVTILVLSGGMFVFVYIAGWILIPAKPGADYTIVREQGE